MNRGDEMVQQRDWIIQDVKQTHWYLFEGEFV